MKNGEAEILGLVKKCLIDMFYQEGITMLEANSVCLGGDNAIQNDKIMIGDIRLITSEVFNENPKFLSFGDDSAILAKWKPNLVPVVAVMKKTKLDQLLVWGISQDVLECEFVASLKAARKYEIGRAHV